MISDPLYGYQQVNVAEVLFIVNNLSAERQELAVDFTELGDRTLVDLVTAETMARTLQKPCRFVLDRYGYRWLRAV